MPLSQRSLVQLGLLLVCVPAQYYLVEYFKTKTTDKVNNYLKDHIQYGMNIFQETVFSVMMLRARIVHMALRLFKGKTLEDENESPAFEVFHFQESKRLFNSRPSSVYFRVGQVVGNLKEGYKGVVIAWKFDEDINDIAYTLLVDEDNTERNAISVVPQEHLYLIESSLVANRYIKIHFYSFDGNQYIPRPWLREKYPDD